MDDDYFIDSDWVEEKERLSITPTNEDEIIVLKKKLKDCYEEKLVLLHQIQHIRLEKRIISEDVPKMKEMIEVLSNDLSEHKDELEEAYMIIGKNSEEIVLEKKRNKKLVAKIKSIRKEKLHEEQKKFSQRLLNSSFEAEKREEIEILRDDIEREKKLSKEMNNKWKKSNSIIKKLRKELSNAPDAAVLKTLQFRISELENNLVESTKKSKEFQKENVELKTRNTELMKKLSSEDRKLRDIDENEKKQRMEEQKESNERRIRISKLKELEKSLSDTLRKKISENSELAKENKEVLSKLRVIQYKNFILNSKIDMTENDRKRISKMKENERQFSVVQRKNQSLRDENESLKQKIDLYRERFDKDAEVIRDLKSKNMEVQKKLTKYDYLYGYGKTVRPRILEELHTKEVKEKIRRLSRMGKF